MIKGTKSWVATELGGQGMNRKGEAFQRAFLNGGGWSAQTR